jgi:hypothetical protein
VNDTVPSAATLCTRSGTMHGCFQSTNNTFTPLTCSACAPLREQYCDSGSEVFVGRRHGHSAVVTDAFAVVFDSTYDSDRC